MNKAEPKVRLISANTDAPERLTLRAIRLFGSPSILSIGELDRHARIAADSTPPRFA